MRVALVGSGPALEAVSAALSDVDVVTGTADPDGIGGADLAVVSAVAGGEALERASATAREAGTRWLAVEIGGIGGHPIPGLDAAVSGFGPGTGCYECLRRRVTANAEDDDLEERPRGDRSAVRLAGAIAGREAVDVLSGGDRILGGAVEVPHARRSFLPVPGCACGDDRDWSLSIDHEAVDPDEADRRAERTLDERVGIVRSIGEVESFPAPYYLAENSETSGFSDATAPRQAAGVDLDWKGAFLKAVGEALERYSAGVYRQSEFVQAPPSTLSDAVPPSAFVRPEDAPAVDPDAPLSWIPGRNLVTGSRVHLPAECVQFPPPSERYTRAITTGLGLYTSTVGALLSGLYETVERDATMLAWYSTYEPLELTVEDERFARLARRARSEDLAVRPLLVTQDVDVPVVAVAVHREDEWPRFAAGSAAALDPAVAARSALAEALQNWMELRSMGRETAVEEPTAIGRYADRPAQTRALLDADGPVPARSVGPEAVPDGEAELTAVLDRVTDAGLTPYAARLTPRDVATAGFEAVRVAVPAAQPLFTGDPFFGERARTVPPALGFEPRLDRAFHPYP